MRSIFSSAFDQGLTRLRIRTIVRLRWIAVLGQSAAVLIVYAGLGFELPIAPCLLIIALSAWLNIYLRFRYPARERLRSGLAATMLGYDVLQLSALLYLTGGLSNPFAFLLIVPVTVSASTQPPRTTIALGVLTALCISALTRLHMPLPWFPGERLEFPFLYIAGVWTALVSGGIFFALYAWRIAKETRQMSDALIATELVLSREQKLSALDGLAAAAAHELGTPLGTITVVAKELLREVPEDSPLREDIELLRSQSLRCREILATLTGSSGEADSAFARVPLTHLLEEIIDPRRGAGVDIHVDAAPEAGAQDSSEPDAARNPGVLYGLGNLLDNALDFAHSRVDVIARWDEQMVSLKVQDDGPGFSEAVIERLGEPYVTSRPVSGDRRATGEEGLGLGFFIAKTLLERSGARLEFSNRKPPESGALVEVSWPRDALDGREDAGERD
ncbi:MAG: ActS/PrrB/RegB family redox-sensitive histidine kinase [Methyloligellaceae bacterium]